MESSLYPMSSETAVMLPYNQDPAAYEESVQGVGLLLERGVLRREDDFGGFEVKRRSLIATSQLTIMHSPDPNIPALPAVPGTAAWNELRQSYLFDKELILRQQHIEAEKALELLLSTYQEKSNFLFERGPPAMYSFYERLQRMFSALNRTVSPLFNGRQRTPYLDELYPAPQKGDQTYEQEFIVPWMDAAKKAINKAITAVRRQLEVLHDIINDIGEESPMGEVSADTRPWSLENEYDTYFTRKADPKSCSLLLDSINSCTDALLGRGAFDFAVPVVNMRGCESDDEGAGGSGSSTTLSFSKMLLPDTWQLVRKAPLFRGSVDGADLMHEIASKLQPLLFSDQTLIIKQGTIGMSMYFVNWGECSVQGGGATLATRTPGEFFGELALTMAQERMADVLAQGTCELFELSRSDFREIIKKYPHVYKRIAAVGTARVKREDWTDRLSESGKVELLDDDELRECANDLSEVTESLTDAKPKTRAAHAGGIDRMSMLDSDSFRIAPAPSRVDPHSECMMRFSSTLLETSGADDFNSSETNGMWNAMATLLQRVTVDANVVMCQKGDTCNSFYIVESGELIVTSNDIEVQRLECGGFFGELSLVFSGSYVMSVTVGPEGAVLLELTKKDLLLVIERYPLLYELLRDQAAISYNVINFGSE
jgi:CRP-like cAMP-binding protein